MKSALCMCPEPFVLECLTVLPSQRQTLLALTRVNKTDISYLNLPFRKLKRQQQVLRLASDVLYFHTLEMA